MDRAQPPREDLAATAARFDDLIQRNAKEAEFQRLFRDHPYIFSRTLRLRHEPTEVVPLGRPGRSEPDFILFPSGENPHGVYGVVEIKRPSTKLIVERRKGLLTLSSSAATALDQVHAYSREIARPPVVHEGHLVMLGTREHLFIVAGLSLELARHIGSELHDRELLPLNCELIPYDILLRRFRQTIPPHVHVLVPDLPVTTSQLEFMTLSDHNALASIDLGASSWEAGSANILRALSLRQDKGLHVVRVARESTTGTLVGAAAFHPRVDLLFDDAPRLKDSAYIPAIGVREDYRNARTPGGSRVTDSQMEDLLGEIQATADHSMPSAWCVYPVDDKEAGRLFTGHGFSRLTSRIDAQHDVWFRQRGLSPAWWRESRAADDTE